MKYEHYIKAGFDYNALSQFIYWIHTCSMDDFYRFTARYLDLLLKSFGVRVYGALRAVERLTEPIRGVTWSMITDWMHDVGVLEGQLEEKLEQAVSKDEIVKVRIAIIGLFTCSAIEARIRQQIRKIGEGK